MERFLKKSSWSDIIISFLFVILGLALISRPEFVTSMISFILGTICKLYRKLSILREYRKMLLTVLGLNKTTWGSHF